MIVEMHSFQEFLPGHEDFVSGHLCQFIIILSNHDQIVRI